MYIVKYYVEYGDLSDTRMIVDAYEVNNFNVPNGFIPTDVSNTWEKTDYYGNTTYIACFGNLVDFARFCTTLSCVED